MGVQTLLLSATEEEVTPHRQVDKIKSASHSVRLFTDS